MMPDASPRLLLAGLPTLGLTPFMGNAPRRRSRLLSPIPRPRCETSGKLEIRDSADQLLALAWNRV
jgi:hypothetical protein